MAGMNERDAKLVQYLSEAYDKERELETSLQAHISMTTRRPYKKRLQQHLRETKSHAKGLERRIKKLGGGGQKTQTVVGKAMAAAKGPLHAVRGGGEQEKMLKNAKTEYFNEHEEIATYLAIETLGGKVGDRETGGGRHSDRARAGSGAGASESRDAPPTPASRRTGPPAEGARDVRRGPRDQRLSAARSA